MRNICEFLRKKDVGSIGIGAMIVFIAMVLVAGIAASVLIQTSTKLETQAMRSGQETIKEVAGGLAVFDVEGRVNSDLQYIGVTIRPRAGSPDIDLNETLVIISDGTQKCVLAYDGWNNSFHFNSSVDSDTGRIFTTGGWANLSDEEFGVIVLEDADSSCSATSPVINGGDKVIVMINCGAGNGCFTAEVAERKDVFGKIMPEIGSPGVISFTTPASYADTVYDLQ